MIDRVIDYCLKAVFSVPSFFIHAAIFAGQLAFHIDQNAITNYISWEAIFLAIMIGVQQLRHHEVVMEKKK